MSLARRRLLGLGVAGGLAVAAPARASDGSLARVLGGGVLRAGVAPERSPLAFVGPDGRPDGLAVALAELLAAGLGVQLELVPPGPRATRARALRDGLFDVLMTGPPMSVAAARELAFTDAFAAADIVLVAPHDRRIGPGAWPATPRIATFVAAEGARGTRPGIPPGASHVVVADAAEALACLSSGACDAAALPDFAARRLLEADAGLEQKALLGHAWFAAALRIGDHELWRAVNGLLGLADQDGVLQILHRAFLARPLPDKRPIH